jgi:hypothetical protein
MFRIFTTAAIAAAMLAFAAPSEAATTDSVFLLHGYNDKANSSGQGDAWDCTANWANQRNALRAYGHTGRVQAIGYYSDNKNCDRNLASTVYTKNFAGDAGVSRQGGPANIQLLTYDTSMTHVAYRFAWAAAREFLDSGRRIHVITDSLGGLIVRQAIAKSSLGDPDFPTLAQMQIMTVHTYGTPFYGTPAGSLSGTIQGVQARVGSGFINDLNSTAYTRVGSARWYSYTSRYLFTDGDGFIRYDSACWLKSNLCFQYRNPAYFHGGYKDDSNFTSLRNGAYILKSPGLTSWLENDPRNDVGAAAVAAGYVVAY